MDIEQKLIELEKCLLNGRTPGTMISRVMKETGGCQWCLGIGAMQMPKSFFYADTIEECVNQALESVKAKVLTKKNVLHGEWRKS